MEGINIPSALEIKEKQVAEERRNLGRQLWEGKDVFCRSLKRLTPSTDLRAYPIRYAGFTYARVGGIGLLAIWKVFIDEIVPALQKQAFVVEPAYDGNDAPWIITLP